MLSVGLVGLPNAGKSTLFNLLTKRSVPAENFPFTTIDPHDGIVSVPDPRVHALATLVGAAKETYAAIEFRDIAGLIKHASQGAGLGNQFLSHIREVDLILLVVRAFQHPDIIHVENRVNPIEDEEILMLELTSADSDVLNKHALRIEKELRSGNDRLAAQKMETIEKIQTLLSECRPASEYRYSDTVDHELKKWRKSLNLLTDKPILRLANISMGGDNVEWNQCDFALDILLESNISEMSSEERRELGISEEAGLDILIRECFRKLHLASFLTAGEKEARAWPFRIGLTAPQCAGIIHSEFEKTFIKADIVTYDDFMAAGGWAGAGAAGKVRTMGKDYLMQDGDVVEFKTRA